MKKEESFSNEDIKMINEEIDKTLTDVNDCFDLYAYEHSLEKDDNLNDNQKKQVKRLEFTSKTKRILAERVGYKCSCPDCNVITVGPGEDQNKVILIGEAAHIIGAILDGEDKLSPRVDSSKTPRDIKSVENGIWLCRNHHKLVDSRTSEYSVSVLRRWKKEAEEKQAKILREQPSEILEKYIFPNISIDKGICSSEFREKEWCLIAFLISNNITSYCFSDDDHPFDLEYQNWMSKNGIKAKTSGLVFNDNYRENFFRIREIVDNLTGLVAMDNESIYTGKLFDDFCEKLYNDDNDFLNKIISKLSIV